MPTSKEFIVTVQSNEWDAVWSLTTDNVQRTLVDAVGYNGDIYVDSVVEFNRADYALTRTHRIGAIKKVRSLINCSLLEAKTLVDAASNRAGQTNVFGVVIDFDPQYGTEAYHVTKA